MAGVYFNWPKRLFAVSQTDIPNFDFVKDLALKFYIMVIIRDILSDFSDEDEIELCGDDDVEGDVEIGSIKLRAGRDYRPGSTNLRNENDLFVGMQFEFKETTIDAIKQFHIRNSFDYIVVELRPDRYVGRCKHFGARCEWRIRASFNVKRDVWEFKKINGTHTYVSIIVSQDHTKLNSSFISNYIINLVSENPGIPIKALLKEIVSRFGYTVTYRKAWIANQIYGDWEGSYNDLPRWMNVMELKTLPVSFLIWYFGLLSHALKVRKMVTNLPLPLLKEKRRKHESGFFTTFELLLPYNRTYVGTRLLDALRTQLPEWCNTESYYCIRHLASYELIRPRYERMLSGLREKIRGRSMVGPDP
ncbi:hypothetical protein Lal_00041572 [Lupinus albus]|nr:hypothetical protein Lal_00041572 [Lupinus albus]